MSLSLVCASVLAIAAMAWWLGFARALRLRSVGRLHSLPVYHGAYAALWAAIPALLLIAAWAPIQSRLVDQAVLSSPEGRALPAFEMQRESILSEAREIAHGGRDQAFNAESRNLAPRIRAEENRYTLMGGGVAPVSIHI
jgi:phosphate transport system permease protein